MRPPAGITVDRRPARPQPSLLPEGIVAVIRSASVEEAVTIGGALAAAGVLHLEITFTIPNAQDAIRELSDTTDANVGAGTVLTAQQASAAADAGARFLVSPTLVPAVLRRAAELDLPSIAGALTPTEALSASTAGASAVKLFPVGSVGGAGYVRALREVFPDIKWVVSGGISAAEVVAYRHAGCTAICLGGALISREALARGDREALVAYAAGALRVAEGP
ncbi:MAG: 2-dehydro-3-deoxyphosphogluconate aldolase [Actinobacteria bacterium HGW-Actinobacteria-8]|nr:MAG: 2-dehydro-3-deoxyphosphogluconate aldolase [Actinobacteria bacterium HGW-Actinobacteria-8]